MSARWYLAFLACYATAAAPLWFLADFRHWNRYLAAATVAGWAAASSYAADRIVRGGRRG